MLYIYILAGLIFVVGYILKSAWFKGWFGELLVNLTHSLCLDKNTYHTLKNVTLPSGDGTTQIDHIIVSKYGIFVVETKNIKGWIFGRTNEDHWTIKLFRQTIKMQNPLRQNYKHVKTLSELLEFSESKFHSLIVFTGESTFKTKMPENVTAGAPSYLAFIKSRKENILSDSDVQFACDKIKAHRFTPSISTAKQHIRYVQELRK